MIAKPKTHGRVTCKRCGDVFDPPPCGRWIYRQAFIAFMEYHEKCPAPK